MIDTLFTWIENTDISFSDSVSLSFIVNVPFAIISLMSICISPYLFGYQ